MTSRKIPEDISARVRAAAGDRCGYCLTRQRYAMQVLEIEHIIPKVVRRNWVSAGWHPPAI